MTYFATATCKATPKYGQGEKPNCWDGGEDDSSCLVLPGCMRSPHSVVELVHGEFIHGYSARAPCAKEDG